jgi:GDPmannose 4,6-dehydratase
MPRALITGVHGQDGALLARTLLDLGWDVHGTARRVETGSPISGLVLHEADLLDVSSVELSWEQPVLTSEVSGRVVADLLQASRELEQRLGREVRFLQASSSEIFGSPSELPQTERTTICPTNPYGVAKAFAHHMVQVARSRGQFASNAILYNHESPERPATFVTRKITRGVAEIATGRAQTITLGNLDARRDWSWAGDVIDAIVAIATAPEPGDFVAASGVSRSVRDFVAAAFAAAEIDDWEGRILQDSRFMRPSDAPEMRGDALKIATELGWHPRVSFEEMVRRMVEHDIAELRGDGSN